VASSLNNLASILVGVGQYQEAEALLLRAHEITEKNFGPCSPLTNNSFENLAEFYQGVGRPDDADKMIQRAKRSCSV
jgi:tetratricopeptide (TPR) repeat protein